MERVIISIKRTAAGQGLPLPQYMTEGSAGLDLFAAVEKSETLRPGEIKLISTGLSMALPPGYEAQIRPRSGLALRHGITMVNTPGTVDADYRGEIGLIMINLGQEPFLINRGDRIAQMVINKVARAEFNVVDDLQQTSRSSGGFGSTGA